MALITSSFYSGCNTICSDATSSNCRGFTDDPDEVGDWFDQTNGNGKKNGNKNKNHGMWIGEFLPKFAHIT